MRKTYICLFVLFMVLGNPIFGVTYSEPISDSLALILNMESPKNQKVVVDFTTANNDKISIDDNLPSRKNISLLFLEEKEGNLIFSGTTSLYYQINTNSNVDIYIEGKNFQSKDSSNIDIDTGKIELKITKNNETKGSLQASPHLTDYDFSYFIKDNNTFIEADIYKMEIILTLTEEEFFRLSNNNSTELTIFTVIG